MSRYRLVRVRFGVLTTFTRFIAVLTILFVIAPQHFADGQTPARPSAAALPAPTDTTAGEQLHSTPLSAGGGFPLSLLPMLTFDGGSSASASMVAADFNGDGKPDIAVSGVICQLLCSGAVVGILLGNGDGTFQPAVNYPTGGLYASLAVADVNGDGKLDIVVVNEFCGFQNFSCIGVLLGNGDGTFQPVVTYNSGGAVGRSVALADLNGDGKLDVVVAQACTSISIDECPFDQPGLIGVLLGNGDGSFQTAVTYSPAGYGTSSIAVGDVNGDGKPDLLVANQCAQICEFNGEGSIGVLLGNGDGTFQPAVTYDPRGMNSIYVTTADLNRDNKLDLVVANSGSVSVLLGNDHGTFQPAVTYSVNLGFSLALADLNGDGKLDLVTAGYAVNVLLGNGDGTFQTTVQSFGSAGAGSWSVIAADLNGDGWPDVVVSDRFTLAYPLGDGDVGVLLNNSGSTFVPTTTLLFSSLNPSSAGQALTFNAIVSSISGTPPNGRPVTFYSYGTPQILGTALLNEGRASITASSLPTGTSGVTALYSGDGRFAPSMSPVLQQVVKATTKSVTSTALGSTLNPSIYGQKVTWTAKVTTAGTTTPTGRVNFMWNGVNSFGTAELNGSGVATLTRAAESADSYPLTALYVGDAHNLGSTSSVLNQVVTKATSSATLASSPNPSTQGEPVTFIAKITSPTVTATGPVTFSAGKTVLGTGQLAGGRASFTTSALPAGSDTVTATYYGDSNIEKSAASVTQVVNGAITTETQETGALHGLSKVRAAMSGCKSRTTLTTSGSPTVVGQEAIFSASVYALAYCDGLPQGSCYETIDFYDGSTLIGSAPLNRNTCVATFTDLSLTHGSHRIMAQFPGSGEGDLPSNSNVITQVVTGDVTATSLTSSLDPSTYGQPVTWTATVTSPIGYFTPPTGKVKFSWGGIYSLGIVPLNSAGVATLTRSLENADTYPLTAVYLGDVNNASSTSPVLSQVVQQAASSATLAASPNPSTQGETVTFIATISSPTVTATGPVTFSAGGTMLGTVQLKGGRASFTTSALPAGSNTITAAYNGDSNIGQSAAMVIETVQP